MAESRKVPRVDWAKYRGGRAAGRREAVAVLGDSLREHGCVRAQGHAAADGTAEEDALLAVAHGVLEALADYFGLPAASLRGAAAGQLSRLPEPGGAAPAPGLLLLLPAVPPGLTVRRPDGEWWEVAAHPGELLVLAGTALAQLTAGRVVAAPLRWAAAGVPAWLLDTAAGAPVAALPAFEG